MYGEIILNELDSVKMSTRRMNKMMANKAATSLRTSSVEQILLDFWCLSRKSKLLSLNSISAVAIG